VILPFALFATFAVKNRLRFSECWERFTTKGAKKISAIVANHYLRSVRPGFKSTIKFAYQLCFPFALFATFAVENRLRFSECWDIRLTA
jgi:hypothetical protein